MTLSPRDPSLREQRSRRDALHSGGLPSPRHPAGKALRSEVRRLPAPASAGEEHPAGTESGEEHSAGTAAGRKHSGGSADRHGRSDGEPVRRAFASSAHNGEAVPGLADEWHPGWTADPRETDAPAAAGAARDTAHRFVEREARNRAGDARDEFAGAPGRRGFGARRIGSGGRGEMTDRSQPPAPEALDWLLRALRRKPISVSEARRELGAAGYDDAVSDAAIDECLRLGYLDDARLAEQLTYIGAERKRQGRSAIARTLAERGIARSVSEEALDPLAADEGERAREFADKKARTMGSLPRDVALRRLVGQLSRRGFGTVALDVARAALDDLASPDGPDAG